MRPRPPYLGVVWQLAKSYVHCLYEITRQNYVSSQVNDVDEFKWVFSQIFRFVARNLH